MIPGWFEGRDASSDSCYEGEVFDYVAEEEHNDSDVCYVDWIASDEDTHESGDGPVMSQRELARRRKRRRRRHLARERGRGVRLEDITLPDPHSRTPIFGFKVRTHYFFHDRMTEFSSNLMAF